MYPHYKKIYGAYHARRLEEALELQVKANNIMNALWDVGLILGIKHVLTIMGIDAGIPGRSFRELTEEQKQYVDSVVETNFV